MSSFQAKALYDFETNIDGELQFNANDVLTIISKDVGNGWWEAKSKSGCVGLVPQSYFEVVNVIQILNWFHHHQFNVNFPQDKSREWTAASQQHKQIKQSTPSSSKKFSGIRMLPELSPKKMLPRLPPSSSLRPASVQSARPVPPVKPPGLSALLMQQKLSSIPPAAAASVAPPPDSAVNNESEEDDEWDYEDDDDDEDDDDYETDNHFADLVGHFADLEQLDRARYDESRAARDDDNYEPDQSRSNNMASKQLNRIVNFTMGGGDAYLFDTHPTPVPDAVAKIVISDLLDGPCWTRTVEPYTCSIRSPKKQSKFHGIKSFIVYQLIPSFTMKQVFRRYKHFDWLQQRLFEKFSTIAIPSLPEKQIAGRFEDEFINDRLRQLQLWLDRMCIHPVIAQSDVFLHFLTCTDTKKWKIGKRAAEKDKYQGGLFFHTVVTPQVALDAYSTESQLESFSRFVRCMDDSVRHLHGVGDSNIKKHQDIFKKEFQKLGGSLEGLAKSFELDEQPKSQLLTRAVANTGKTYCEVGKMFEEQPIKDMVPLMEGLAEYKGLLSTFPDILLVHRASTNKIQENAGRFSEDEIQMIQNRADVITYTVLAEMDHFQCQRLVDFENYMQRYLSAQIIFYREVTQRLEETLKNFEKL